MTCSCSVGYTQSRITENQPGLLSNLHKMRTLQNNYQSNLLEQSALRALWHCHAFNWGWQVLFSFYDWQKSAIHPTKKIVIHLRETQSVIRSRWTPNIQKPGWLSGLRWKIFGGLLYIRLNVSGSLFHFKYSMIIFVYFSIMCPAWKSSSKLFYST